MIPEREMLIVVEMTDSPPLYQCILENSLHGLIANSKTMVNKLHENGNISMQVISRMKVGWAAYIQAYERNWRARHPPPPPPVPPRQP